MNYLSTKLPPLLRHEWIKLTRDKSHRIKWHSSFQIISKVTQAAAILFQWTRNTIINEVIWPRSEPVLNIVHDFALGVKRWFFNVFFSGRKNWWHGVVMTALTRSRIIIHGFTAVTFFTILHTCQRPFMMFILHTLPSFADAFCILFPPLENWWCYVALLYSQTFRKHRCIKINCLRVDTVNRPPAHITCFCATTNEKSISGTGVAFIAQCSTST